MASEQSIPYIILARYMIIRNHESAPPPRAGRRSTPSHEVLGTVDADTATAMATTDVPDTLPTSRGLKET